MSETTERIAKSKSYSYYLLSVIMYHEAMNGRPIGKLIKRGYKVYKMYNKIKGDKTVGPIVSIIGTGLLARLGRR